MELFYDVIRKRRSVRKFEPGKKISKKALKRIVDCGRWSPSGANTQCFDFLVIEQKETLKKVTSIFLNQAQRLVDNYEEVLKTIDEGAETGFIMSKLPSLRAASQRLDALQQELGLNVIANTTFGALSESELNFALRTALPTNLNPDQLKIEIQRRLEVQNKLIAYMMEAQKFIRDGGTVNGFLEQKYDEQKAKEKKIHLIYTEANITAKAFFSKKRF